MGESKTIEDWRADIEPALISKAKELQLMGYPEATKEDVWDCLVAKVWKNNPSKRLHEVVQDIFHLRTNTYMSYLTVQAQANEEDLLTSIQALNI